MIMQLLLVRQEFKSDLSNVVGYIKEEKHEIFVLQDLPYLSDAEMNSQVIEPLEHEYKIYRDNSRRSETGRNNVSSDNLMLILAEINVQEMIGIEYSPNISLIGVVVEKPDNDCLKRHPVFDVVVEAGATDSDILENVLNIQKIFMKQRLTTDDIEVIGQYGNEEWLNLLERVLGVPIRARGPTGWTRKSKRKINRSA